MTHEHLVGTALLVPRALFGALGIVIFLAGIVGYCGGLYERQKIAILTGFAGLSLAATQFLLMTGEGSDIIYGHRVDWGFGVGNIAVFGLMAAMSTYFLILYDWASKIEITLVASNAVALAVFTVLQYDSGKIVVFIAAVGIQLAAAYLAVANAVRMDVQGWIYAIGVLLFKLVFHVFVAVSPDGFGAPKFSRELYAWVYGGAITLYIIVVATYAYVFIESDKQYRRRNNLPEPVKADGSEDAVPLHLIPGQSPGNIV